MTYEELEKEWERKMVALNATIGEGCRVFSKGEHSTQCLDYVITSFKLRMEDIKRKSAKVKVWHGHGAPGSSPHEEEEYVDPVPLSFREISVMVEWLEELYQKRTGEVRDDDGVAG